MTAWLRQKLKEAYWEITRAIGLERIHGLSFGQILAECGKPFGQFARETWPRLRRRAVHEAYRPLAYLLSRANVHFVNPPCLQLERIGHLAEDFDAYLKERFLTGRKFHTVLLCSGC